VSGRWPERASPAFSYGMQSWISLDCTITACLASFRCRFHDQQSYPSPLVSRLEASKAPILGDWCVCYHYWLCRLTNIAMVVLPAFGESKRAHFWLSPAIWLSVWLSSALCEFSDCTMRFISAVRALVSERIHHGIRQLRLQPQTLLYLAAGRADWPLAKRFTGHIICASPDEDADSLSCSFSMQTTVLFSLPRLSAWSFFYRLIKPALLLPWIYQKTTPIRTCLGRSPSHHLQHEYRVLLKFIR
jgi:hypothetical protein